MNEARMRVGTLRDTLEAARQADTKHVLDGGEGAHVFARLEAQGPLEWAPVEDVVTFYEHLFRALGAAEARKICHSSMLTTLSKGILKQVASAAMRKEGERGTELTPMVVLEYGPKTFQLVTENCGSQEILNRSENGANVRWTGTPKKLLQSEAWCDSMVAKYRAQIELPGGACSASIGERDASAGVIEFRLRW